MLTIKVLLFISFHAIIRADESEEPVLYYYGIEESERSLPLCEEHQACSVLVQRYWRPPALVRLCRCGRRLRCDKPAAADHRIEINNRADMQFCQAITSWVECSFNDAPLTVTSEYDRMNPDDLEEMHHQEIQLIPPKITVNCRCPIPNHWKLKSSKDDVKVYQCQSLPICSTDQFCGNVNYDLNALFQSCLCPKHHLCVHNGGVTHIQISELMYDGKGWKAYCQRIDNEYSDEEY